MNIRRKGYSPSFSCFWYNTLGTKSIRSFRHDTCCMGTLYHGQFHCAEPHTYQPNSTNASGLLLFADKRTFVGACFDCGPQHFGAGPAGRGCAVCPTRGCCTSARSDGCRKNIGQPVFQVFPAAKGLSDGCESSVFRVVSTRWRGPRVPGVRLMRLLFSAALSGHMVIPRTTSAQSAQNKVSRSS